MSYMSFSLIALHRTGPGRVPVSPTAGTWSQVAPSPSGERWPDTFVPGRATRYPRHPVRGTVVGADVLVEARITKLGRRMAFADITMTAEGARSRRRGRRRCTR
ncbi:hypothetical protein GCM10010381_49860 [Streptomyces xantholiticus]|nr:hypothetical protein GCM10010381_49860 [Streptomyces xantholiticus]